MLTMSLPIQDSVLFTRNKTYKDWNDKFNQEENNLGETMKRKIEDESSAIVATSKEQLHAKEQNSEFSYQQRLGAPLDLPRYQS